MSSAPVALFVYNRPWHVQKTVESLLRNEGAEDTEITIFCDGARTEDDKEKVDSVRNYLHCISGFKKITIIERLVNYGLAGSIVDGVTSVIKQYGKIIVLEDDMVTSKFFLKFMNDALKMYKIDESVGCIHGYLYPVKQKMPETFFIRGTGCWGWATWERAWNFFESDGNVLLNEIREKVDSYDFNMLGGINFISMLEGKIARKNNAWDVCWYASIYLKNMLCLWPGKSLVENIGNDGTGVHSTKNKLYDVSIMDEELKFEKKSTQEDKDAKKAISEYFHSIKGSIINRIKRKIGIR